MIWWRVLWWYFCFGWAFWKWGWATYTFMRFTILCILRFSPITAIATCSWTGRRSLLIIGLEFLASYVNIWKATCSGQGPPSMTLRAASKDYIVPGYWKAERTTQAGEKTPPPMNVLQKKLGLASSTITFIGLFVLLFISFCTIFDTV